MLDLYVPRTCGRTIRLSNGEKERFNEHDPSTPLTLRDVNVVSSQCSVVPSHGYAQFEQHAHSFINS